MVKPLERAARLDRNDVGGIFHHAQQSTIAGFIGAGGARICVRRGECSAFGTAPDRIVGGGKRRHQRLHQPARFANQRQRRAGRRPPTEAGKFRKTLLKLVYLAQGEIP
jgi:hypothetical protein